MTSQIRITRTFRRMLSVSLIQQANNPTLSALCDRDIYQAEKDGSAIVSGTRYPSKYLNRYIKEVDKSVKKMLSDHGFRDGMVSPMAFVDDNGFYMCEMCYRPSGGHHFTLIKDQTGIDGLALLIEFAVTGRIQNYMPEKENPAFSDYCGMIHIPGVPGKKIVSMEGIEAISDLPFVLEVCEELRPGQVVGKDGTTAQTIASIWLKGKDYEEYTRNIEKIRLHLKAFDEEGNSIIKTV